MCGKVFKFKSKYGFTYLNGDDRIKSIVILEMYVHWYNTDFAPLENLPEIDCSEFEFVESFCPIDFYDETRKITRR